MILFMQVGKLPGKYKKYFEDLELKNRLLHKLPRKLRKIIVHQGWVYWSIQITWSHGCHVVYPFAHSRDVTHICDFLKQLADMELITLEGWDVKNKATVSYEINKLHDVKSVCIYVCGYNLQVSICLNRSMTILDTSTTQPRCSFFTNEARHLFQPITFSFVSLADVERFWFKLQTICRQTPIILSESNSHSILIRFHWAVLYQSYRLYSNITY